MREKEFKIFSSKCFRYGEEFYASNTLFSSQLTNEPNKIVLALGKVYQLSPKFVGRDRSSPLSGALEMCFTLEKSSLERK
jgi:hypothetical protein